MIHGLGINHQFAFKETQIDYAITTSQFHYPGPCFLLLPTMHAKPTMRPPALYILQWHSAGVHWNFIEYIWHHCWTARIIITHIFSFEIIPISRYIYLQYCVGTLVAQSSVYNGDVWMGGTNLYRKKSKYFNVGSIPMALRSGISLMIDIQDALRKLMKVCIKSI